MLCSPIQLPSAGRLGLLKSKHCGSYTKDFGCCGATHAPLMQYTFRLMFWLGQQLLCKSTDRNSCATLDFDWPLPCCDGYLCRFCQGMLASSIDPCSEATPCSGKWTSCWKIFCRRHHIKYAGNNADDDSMLTAQRAALVK